IGFEDGSYWRFPMLRWSFSHWRELVPTVNVSRGPAPVSELRCGLREDLDDVTFTPLGSSRTMTWAESLDANYTDGIIVLHRGRIVYERYFGALDGERPHIAFSVTKSLFGTLASALIAQGQLDATAAVSQYIPELKDSGFGDATVSEVLDMTSALDYDEHYDDPKSAFHDYAQAAGYEPRPRSYAGPHSSYAYLATVRKAGKHGEHFIYRSINTDVTAWIIARVTGKAPQEALREGLWSQLGMEGDAYMQVDAIGTAVASGGLNARLRDLARFGDMVRQGGKYQGRRIIPEEAIAAIRAGGSPAAFAGAGYHTLPGWSYRRQWWVSHDDHGVFMARGIHGQAIYIDPKADMVIARFASHPLAGNINLDPTSLPAYRAIAEHLMAVPP
ncbi:MAG: 6-aminohexanoate-dimer hydrolase, partial [Gammaproteobacteria bacterium]|nr:6-aminohexanoate-dimer hydrolase [Gammaproteobacteria bacterium]